MCAYFALNVLLNSEYSHIYGTGVFSAIQPIRYLTHHALRTLYLHHNYQEQETFSCIWVALAPHIHTNNGTSTADSGLNREGREGSAVN